MTGYEDGSFRPDSNITVNEFKNIAARLGYQCRLEDSDAPVTRAETVKQLCLILGRNPDANSFSGGSITFTDVPSSSEYYKYIVEAANIHTFDVVDGAEMWNALG